jgi:hypothetical protein
MVYKRSFLLRMAYEGAGTVNSYNYWMRCSPYFGHFFLDIVESGDIDPHPACAIGTTLRYWLDGEPGSGGGGLWTSEALTNTAKVALSGSSSKSGGGRATHNLHALPLSPFFSSCCRDRHRHDVRCWLE